MPKERESFLDFWKSMLKIFTVAGFVCLILLYGIGGSLFVIVLGFFLNPLTLLITVPFTMYFYYWCFGDNGIRYNNALKRLENWSDMGGE